MRTRFTTLLLVAAAVVPVGLTVGAAGPALAAKAPKPSITCNVTGSATITPGVSNTPAKQTLRVTLTLSGCTGSSVAGITGSSAGTSSVTGKTPETCADLTKPSKPSTTVTTIDWNNGSTSGITYKTVLSSGTGTSTGKVTSGTFDKGKISSVISYVPGQNCTSVALTSATISGTFKIT